ncbi:MAG: adventurous gliding motility protein CglE, partial [Proteobacteria bacterium]|nr:adventurous gliding motility protein CglE [Pseudomonadota bacterium]
MRILQATVFLALTGLLAPAASAQDFEDLDSPTSSKKSSKKKRERRQNAEADIIREIERGYFLKAGVGSTAYLLAHGSPLLSPGTTTAISGGGDFFDTERMSMAWELSFEQGLHNGAKYEDQAGMGANQLIQGDIHTFSILATYEVSWYVTRRLGLGLRAGGGVMLTPLLVHRDSYIDIVVAQHWGGLQPNVHETPHPVVGGGPTIEYYTKLSHFSVGIEVNAFYAIGFDLGIYSSGYLKYT